MNSIESVVAADDQVEEVEGRKLGPYQQSIADVVDWMQEANIDRVEVAVSGGGDEGILQDFRFYREGDELDDCEAEGFEELEDDIELAAFELAPWEISNGEGGNATLTIHADGRYAITGGWYGGYSEARPVYGTVSDVPADTSTGEDYRVLLELTAADGRLLRRYLKRHLKRLPASNRKGRSMIGRVLREIW